MKDFDEDPLDLFGDDGDGVNEMCLLFDENGEKNGGGKKFPGGSGCCVILLAGAGLLSTTAWSIAGLLSQ